MNQHTRIAATKLQHHVFYVSDLKRSNEFYTKLFDMQFSALNHPDSSAAMRLANLEMNFLSFGHYHHDICLVLHRSLKLDNNSMLSFTFALRDEAAFKTVLKRAQEMGLAVRMGRLLVSAKPVAHAFCVPDPDNHWIEIVVEN
jgi:catechol 2,3-dioxygenase-like lactoylglutathione lyase family enzyme